MRIAVIGSGISGMAAAYYLSRKHEVFVFEKESIFLKSLERLRGGSLELIANGRTWEFGEPDGRLRATGVVDNDRFFQRALFGGNVWSTWPTLAGPRSTSIVCQERVRYWMATETRIVSASSISRVWALTRNVN